MPQHHDMRCPARVGIPGFRGKRAEATEATAAAGTCGSEVVLGQREGVEHDGHIAEAVRASARGALRLVATDRRGHGDLGGCGHTLSEEFYRGAKRRSQDSTTT
jgi:hypothetical protein